MGIRFAGDHPENERVEAVIALAIAAYLDAEGGPADQSVTQSTRWVAAGRLEVRGIPVSLAVLTRGWRVSY
jgi:hypothetical protein